MGRNPATSVTTVDRLSSIMTMWQPQFVEPPRDKNLNKFRIVSLAYHLSIHVCVCVCVIRAEKHLRV